MLHYIIVKLNDLGKNQVDLISQVNSVFSDVTKIDGVSKISVCSNAVHLANRYDLMIVLEMEPEALALFDASEIHANWKKSFAQFIEHKVIFDCEKPL